MRPAQEPVQAPTPPAPPTPPEIPIPPIPDVHVEIPDVHVEIPPGVAEGPTTILRVPATRNEVQALRSRRSELSEQLTSAVGRREKIAKELETATGVNRAGLEERLKLLDARILRLESDIAENGRLLAAAPASLAQSTAPARMEDGPMGLSSGQITGISIVSLIFVFMPLAVGAARVMWKRSSRPVVPAIPAETQQRLERMEQAVDAIAIEVERVSESQRFLTRILTEAGDRPALGVGQRQAEPVRVAGESAVRVPVGE